jgi:hypothetical protein
MKLEFLGIKNFVFRSYCTSLEYQSYVQNFEFRRLLKENPFCYLLLEIFELIVLTEVSVDNKEVSNVSRFRLMTAPFSLFKKLS